MKTLILYSTRDGQTKKIVDFIAERLNGDVAVHSVTDFHADLAPFDNIIIGASIRYEHFDKHLYKTIEKLTARKCSLIFGLCIKKSNFTTMKLKVWEGTFTSCLSGRT